MRSRSGAGDREGRDERPRRAAPVRRHGVATMLGPRVETPDLKTMLEGEEPRRGRPFSMAPPTPEELKKHGPFIIPTLEELKIGGGGRSHTPSYHFPSDELGSDSTPGASAKMSVTSSPTKKEMGGAAGCQKLNPEQEEWQRNFALQHQKNQQYYHQQWLLQQQQQKLQQEAWERGVQDQQRQQQQQATTSPKMSVPDDGWGSGALGRLMRAGAAEHEDGGGRAVREADEAAGDGKTGYYI